MTFGIPQIIILGFMFISLGIHIAKHGEPKLTKYHFVADFISSAITCGILYWGGFFG
jgi:hypothetical protein